MTEDDTAGRLDKAQIERLQGELKSERTRVDFLTDEIERLEEDMARLRRTITLGETAQDEIARLRKENEELRKYIAEGAPQK